MSILIKIIFSVMLLFTGFVSKAQTGKAAIEAPRPTNVERFKIDYEIKGWTIIQDTVKLNSLNLDYFDALRDLNVDKEVFDRPTLLTIILYAKSKGP